LVRDVPHILHTPARFYLRPWRAFEINCFISNTDFSPAYMPEV